MSITEMIQMNVVYDDKNSLNEFHDEEGVESEQLHQHMLYTLYELLKEQSQNGSMAIALALMIKKITGALQQKQPLIMSMQDFDSMIENFDNGRLPETHQYDDAINKLVGAITAYQDQVKEAEQIYNAYIDDRTKAQTDIDNILPIVGIAILLPGLAFLGVGLVALSLPAFAASISSGIIYEFITVGAAIILSSIALTACSHWVSTFITNFYQDIDNAESIRMGSLTSVDQEYQVAIESICDAITILEDEAHNQSVASRAITQSPLLANSMLANNRVQPCLDEEQPYTVGIASFTHWS